MTLFISLFTTLLAIINPLEAVPVFLNLLQGKDQAAHRSVAWKSEFLQSCGTMPGWLAGH